MKMVTNTKSWTFPKFYIMVPMPVELKEMKRKKSVTVKIPINAEYDHVPIQGSVTITRYKDREEPDIEGALYRLSPYGTIEYEPVDANDWEFGDQTDVWFEDKHDADSEVHIILCK